MENIQGLRHRYKSRPGVIQKRHDESASDDEDEYSSKAPSVQDLVELMFEFQFKVILMVGTFVSMLATASDAAYSLGIEVEGKKKYTATLIIVCYCIDIMYMADIFAMIAYKNMYWYSVRHIYEERSNFLLVVEIMSLVPLDLFYYKLTKAASMKVVYLLRLRYCLRIFRLFHDMIQLEKPAGQTPFVAIASEFIVAVSFTLLTATNIIFLHKCFTDTCTTDILLLYFYIVCSKITGRGFIRQQNITNTVYWVSLTISFIMYFFIKGWILGKLICTFKQLTIPDALFNNRLQEISEKCKGLFKKDPLIHKAFKQYYSLFWKYRSGKMDTDIAGIIPIVLVSEIRLDLSWNALKHSHLFRTEPVDFLHHISSFVKHVFMIPGEIIYKRDEFKSKMVYLANGVIEIFSEVDGETPIMVLTAGTCLGESSLVISYPSSCTVICQTYCELDILERKDFVKIMDKYPEQFEKFHDMIFNRYNEAKSYVKVKAFERTTLQSSDDHSYSLRWMKLTLRKLLSKDSAFMDKYLGSITTDDRLIVSSVLKRVYCAKYLDLFVLDVTPQHVGDRVFVKTSCPCVLQPDSMITRSWQKLIGLTMLTLTFAYPYFALYVGRLDGWYSSMMFTVTTLWWLDVYFQVSTAIITKTETLVHPLDIAVAKSKQSLFILDVLAAVPIEVIAYWINGDIESYASMALQLNRLLKFPRIEYIFRSYQENIGHDLVTLKLIKYFFYITILVYWISAIYFFLMEVQGLDEKDVYYNIMKEMDPTDTSHVILFSVFLGTHLVTGLSFCTTVSGTARGIYLPLIATKMFLTVLLVVILADITATITLKKRARLILQEYVKNTKYIMRDLQLDKALRGSITRYIYHQWFSGRGSFIVYPGNIMHDMPRELFLIITHSIFKDTLTRVPLFQHLPKEVEINCCGYCTMLHIPPGQFLTCAGEVSHEMYMISKGYCDLISMDRTFRRILGPGDSIAVVETCLNIPVMNSVVTRTSCELVALSYDNFKKGVSIDPGWCSDFAEVTKTGFGVDLTLNLIAKEHDLEEDVAEERGRSFCTFGYCLNPESTEGIEYLKPFERLGYWSFLRFFLLRHTILSDGNFIRYYEIFRCIIAVLSVVLFSIPPVVSCDCFWYWILRFLDVIAWVDIYLRHHICYFNDQGIRVKHPLKTATNYWKHSFIIDVLATFPLYEIFRLFYSDKVTVYLSANRVLQAYRVVQILNYKKEMVGCMLRLWTPLIYVSLVTIAIIYSSIIVLSISCTFHHDIEASEFYQKGVYCRNDSFFTVSDFPKPISPMRTYLYAVYLVCSAFFASGIQGFHIVSITKAITIAGFTFVGFVTMEYITANIISVNLLRNVDLTRYQKKMMELSNFLNMRRIDYKLKKELADNFEYIWSKHKGKNYKENFDYFNNSLKEDVMYSIFGRSMESSTIFSEADTSFFRTLLLKAKHEIIIRRGIISRVNDVDDWIFFISKGQVEVLAPDYSRLLVLPAGSMFGNLDSVKYGRRTLTMVAKGHVELLKIRACDFYAILNMYTRVKLYFKKLLVVNVDYMVGGPLPQMSRMEKVTVQESAEEILTNIAKMKRTKAMIVRFLISVHRNDGGYVIWHKFLLFISFIGFNLDIYRMAVRDQSAILVFVLYFFDLIFIIKIYFEFHMSFENEHGILIKERKEIALHYLKSRLGFKIDFISVVPFELLAFIFAFNLSLFHLLLCCCRLNRLIRMVFVMDYFIKTKEMISVNITRVHTLQIITALILLINLVTFSSIIIGCVDEENKQIPCNFEELSSEEKFIVYLKVLGATISTLTATPSESRYPISALHIFISIVLIFGGRFVVMLLVAEFCAMLEVATTHKSNYEQKMSEFKKCLETLGLSPVLVKSTWRYMAFLWKKHGGLQFPTLLEEAPYYLREAVLNSMFGVHLRSHPILKQCHKDLIRQMAARMQTLVFFTGDIIAFQGEMDELMYFIHYGEVDVVKEDVDHKETKVNTLLTGDSFGLDQGMYHRCGHEFKYRASGYVITIVLERKAWIHLLDFFPASKELIFMPPELN